MTWDAKARRRLDRIEADGFGHLPVCVAKTQYSFSTDATLRGAPSGPPLQRARGPAFRRRRVRRDALRRRDDDAGLPKEPSASKIDLADDGTILGLS